MIGAHYDVNGDRYNGLQVSCNSVRTIYLRSSQLSYNYHINTGALKKFANTDHMCMHDIVQVFSCITHSQTSRIDVLSRIKKRLIIPRYWSTFQPGRKGRGVI